MKTGDIVTDSRASAWTLGALLGEGAWGRTWVVRDDSNRTRVLKAPFEAEDLPPASADRVPLMRACAIEQADVLAQGGAHLVPLEDRITLPTGAIALLLPYAPTTLARQLTSGIPLVECLDEVADVAKLLVDARATHGNLRPTNILIGSDGRPMLSDPLTPTLETLLPGAQRIQPERRRWSADDHIASDTWALCSALFSAVMLDETSGDGPTALPEPSRSGLDKVTLANLRDHAVARLRRDGANPRFIQRTSERLTAVLARGLSAKADPSPPYRFLKANDLHPRLQEVRSLVRPGIESVGRLILSSAARNDVFDSPGPVGFTVSVGPTHGVNDPDDLVCGVRLTDLDAPGDGRVPLHDAQFAVNRHPSGRLRFEFNLPDIPPGRYDVRVAFSIKDSAEQPVVAEGRFDVRPPPGYVPPAEEAPAATPLAFPNGIRSREEFQDDDDSDEESPTVLMSTEEMLAALDQSSDGDTDAGGELIDAFPRPLAPTAPGTLIDEPPLPPLPPEPPPRPAPPPLMAVPSIVTEATEPPIEDTATPVTAPGHSIPPPIVAAVTPPAPAPPAPEVTPAPSPLGEAPAAWASSQPQEAEFFQEGGLPGGGEDLLPGQAGSPLDKLPESVREFVRPDSPKFFAVVVVGCFLLIVVLLTLLRAC